MPSGRTLGITLGGAAALAVAAWAIWGRGGADSTGPPSADAPRSGEWIAQPGAIESPGGAGTEAGTDPIIETVRESDPAAAAADDPAGAETTELSPEELEEAKAGHGRFRLERPAPDIRDLQNPEFWKINGGRIFGKVIRAADRSPVEGVWFDVARNIVEVPGSRLGGFYGQEARSDEEGEFEITGLPPGNYRIMAHHNEENLISTRHSDHDLQVLISQPREARGPFTIQMTLAGRLRIAVTDAEAKRPIEGATVSVGLEAVVTTRTDANGEAVIGGLINWPLQVAAWAPGYAKEIAKIRVGLSDEFPVSLELKPGGEAFGRVTRDGGEPIAGVRVYHRKLWPSGAYASANDEHPTEVKTDRDGFYRIEHLPVDSPAQLGFEAKGFASLSSEKFELAREKPEKEIDVTLTAEDSDPVETFGSISGTVIDFNGRPVSAAAVDYRGPGPRSLAQYDAETGFKKTVTDAAGLFRLDELDWVGEQGRLGVRAPGLAVQFIRIAPGTTEQPAEITVTLKEGHFAAGTVVDGRDRPVEGVEVYPQLRADGVYGDTMHVYSTESGEWRLENLPEGTTFDFYSNNGPRHVNDARLELDRDDHVVELPDPLLRLGRVVDDATGQAIQRFKLNGAENFHPNGEFRIDKNVRSGSQPLHIGAIGYPPKRFVTTETSTDFDLNPIELRMPRGATISGVVVDGAGNAKAGVEVTAFQYHAPRNPARSSFNWNYIEPSQRISWQSVNQRAAHYYDWFEASTAAGFAYQVATTGRSGEFAFTNVGTDGRAVDIAAVGRDIARTLVERVEELPRGEWGALRVVVSAGGRVIGRINRTVYPDASSIVIGGRTIALATPEQTNFELDGLAPGDYTYAVQARRRTTVGGRTMQSTAQVAQGSFSLEEGEQEVLEIGFGESFRVGGRVLFGAEPMVEGDVLISSARDASQVLRQVKTNLQGEFMAEGILAGAYHVIALPPGDNDYNAMYSSPNRAPIDVAGGDVIQDFVFAATASVRGRLLNPPAPRGVTVSLTATQPSATGNWANYQANADAQGGFRFGAVAPGQYQLSLQASGASISLARGIVVPEGGGELDLGELEAPATRRVIGRIAGLATRGATSLLLQSSQPEQSGLNAQTQLGADGTFTFGAVQPGAYNMSYFDNTGGPDFRALFRDLQIPAGEGDYDLGELTVEPGGSLVIRIEGGFAGPGSANVGVFGLAADGASPDHGNHLGSAQIAQGQQSVTLSNLPAGGAHVQISGQGLIAEPNNFSTTIVSGQPVEVSVRIESITQLMLFAPQAQEFTAVTLTYKSTGESVSLVRVDQPDPSMMQGTAAMFTADAVFAQGINPGVWIVSISARGGGSFTGEYDVQTGRPIQEQIVLR